MSITLTKTQVLAALTKLNLPRKSLGHARELAKLLNDDSRVNLSTIIDQYLDDSEPENATKTVENRVASINEAARQTGISMSANLAPSDGSGTRWLWFEAPDIVKPSLAPDMSSKRDLEEILSGGPSHDEAPVVIVLCFNNNELDAITRLFGITNRHDCLVSFRNRSYYDLGVHSGMHVILEKCRMGQLEAHGATLALAWMPNARAVIACGIGFGIDAAKQKIGDVLVVDDSLGYESQRLSRGGTREPRGRSLAASRLLSRRLERIRDDWNNNPAMPRVNLGPFLSGEKLIDDKDEKNALLRLYSGPFVGGDMESFAVAHAAQEIQETRSFDWIAIKGISDFAENKNTPTKQDDQKRAAHNAAVVLWLLLNSNPPLFTHGLPSSTSPVGSDPGRVRTSPGGSDSHSTVSEQARSLVTPSPNLTDLIGIGAALIGDRQGVRTSGRDLNSGTSSESATDIIEALLAWVQDDSTNTSPLFVLQGDYGIGKTIACQTLTHTLLEARKNHPNARLPLYFDLRNVSGLGHHVPSVDEVFRECIDKGWVKGDVEISLRQIWTWIDEGALVIFDGLDEVLSRMSPDDGARFSSALQSVISSQVTSQSPPSALRRRVLISSRTEFFPTQEIARRFFDGRLNSPHPTDDARITRDTEMMVLQPFTDRQIMTYLDTTLNLADKNRVVALLEDLHDVHDLAARPFNLRVIAMKIPDLEKRRSRGGRVRAIDIYRLLVSDVIEKAQPNSHMHSDDKTEFLSHLAVMMWQRHLTAITLKNLETQFAEWQPLDAQRRWRLEKIDREILLEDLRNSTLLSRVDTTPTKAEFRFSHVSQFEYFLAMYLFSCVKEDRPEKWALTVPSVETLDFLGQFLAEAEDQSSDEFDPRVMTRLQRWVTEGDILTTTMILRYTLRQLASGDNHDPVPSLVGIRLAEGDLDGLQIRREWQCDLSYSDFSGASMRNCILDGCNLNHASFETTDLSFSCILTSQCLMTRFDRTTLRGATLRNTDVTGSTFSKNSATGCWVISCSGISDTLKKIPDVVIAPTEPSDAGSSGHLVQEVGHTGTVWSLAWSPDGTRLASASADRSILIWDTTTGHHITTLEGHTDAVRSVTWSPDGSCLASASADQSVRIWDTTTGHHITTLTGHTNAVLSVAWSPDGTHLASGSADQSIFIWNTITGHCIRTLSGHTNSVMSVAWSTDGKRLASASADQSVRIWDAVTGHHITTLTGHTNSVLSVTWSPDGTRLASGSADCSIRIWDACTGQPTTTLTDHTDWVWSLDWSPDSTRLASASDDQSVRIWDTTTGHHVTTLTGHTHWVQSVAWSPDGTRLASASDDRSILIWDTTTGHHITTLTGHVGAVQSVDWSPDGTRLASASDDQSLRIWDTTTGHLIATLTGQTSLMLTVAWSPDGTRLASGSDDRSILIWDTTTGHHVTTLTGHTNSVLSVAWSPDGTRLASASDDRSILIWDTTTGHHITTLTGHVGAVQSVDWSPDGTRLASASDDQSLRIWDTHGHQIMIFTGHTNSVLSVAWSPDGDRLASGSADRSVRIWDTTTGHQISRLDGHTNSMETVAWSPDGILLASGSTDRSVRIWDTTTGHQISRLDGHTRSVWSVAWSPDGIHLASGSNDRSVRIWDTRSEVTQLVFDNLPSWPTPDIHNAVSWDEGGSCIWASPNAWRFLMCQVPTDGTTPMQILPAEYFGRLPS